MAARSNPFHASKVAHLSLGTALATIALVWLCACAYHGGSSDTRASPEAACPPPTMPHRPIETVWSYPRPPALQPTSARLRVVWRGADGKTDVTLADTTKGYRVLETSHPPTYYFPPADVNVSLLSTSRARRTMCEWKGMALYHDVAPTPGGEPVARGRVWSYPTPTPAFKAIKNYFCFYASSSTDPSKTGRWHCYVDDDEVEPQEGDFYGSWITPEIQGGDRGFKGGAGTWGW